MTLRDNIKISDMSSDMPLGEVLSEAEIPLTKFTDGLDTMLSREFDGAE